MTYEVKILNGWVEKRNGKLAYRVDYFNELTQSVKRKQKKIDKDTPQARNKARQIIIVEIQKMYEKFEHSTLTLQELKDRYDEYIDSGKSGLHYQTGYQYKSNVKQFLIDVNTHILADNIQVSYFNKYFDKMFAAGKSYSYVNLRKAAIANMYQFGLDYGYLKANPLIGYKLHHRREPAKLIATEDKFFTPDEMQKLLEHFKHNLREDYYDLIEWLYLTGMRIGEAVSLYPSDIIVRNGKYYAKVVGTQIAIHKEDGTGHIEKQSDTKTLNGTRFVELEDKAIKIYERHKNSKSYLFVTQSKTARGLKKSAYGKPFRANQVYQAIGRAAKKQKIEKLKIDQGKKGNIATSHMLRHTYVSREAAYGKSFDMDFLEQIGHGDEKITREIYNHINRINKEDLKKGFMKLDESLS